jgi:hypothetical protein
MTAPAVALAPVLIDGTGAGAMPGTTSLHGELLNRAVRDDYQQWLTSVAPAARCVRPILLGGRMHEVDAATGEIPFTLNQSLPNRVIYTACGDRRASVCPSCAETYRRDTYPTSRTTAASMGLAFSTR